MIMLALVESTLSSAAKGIIVESRVVNASTVEAGIMESSTVEASNGRSGRRGRF